MLRIDIKGFKVAPTAFKLAHVDVERFASDTVVNERVKSDISDGGLGDRQRNDEKKISPCLSGSLLRVAGNVSLGVYGRYPLKF